MIEINHNLWMDFLNSYYNLDNYEKNILKILTYRFVDCKIILRMNRFMA